MQDQIDIDFGQEEIIEYVKQQIDIIQTAKSKEDKEYHLFKLLAFLISSSNDIAQQGDFYEAGGRLYSAAYYLEEFYPKEAMDVYSKATEFYDKYYSKKIQEGAANEAANVAIRIANIYRDKIHHVEKDREYVQKAIELIATQIDIMGGIGTPRELGAKFQTLSMLYTRIQDWEAVIKAARTALEYAKNIKSYSIIANAYNDIALAFEATNQSNQAQNILFEAMDFFSKEAEIHEIDQDLLPLSQLYQIIKNLYGVLRDSHRFEIYSRKEAAVYIALAKMSLMNNSSNAQIASYYRGAGLCYRETKNELDCATCFLLAGNYYSEAKKYVEAAINYQDAASMFEKLQNWKKAFEFYIKGGESAARAKNMETSIENYIHAYDMAEKDGTDLRRVTNLLCKQLSQFAETQETEKHYFVAATLQLEAALYARRGPEPDHKQNYDFLSVAYKNYCQAANKEGEAAKESMITYAYALAMIIANAIGDNNGEQAALERLKQLKTKLSTQYIALNTILITNLKVQRMPSFTIEEKALEKLWESSEEMVKICHMFCK
jgi:tetratricopeptide (TPR) repeat protein